MLINIYIYNLLIIFIFFNFSICNWLRLGTSNYELPSLEFIKNFNHRERHTNKKMKIIESPNNQQENINRQLNITNIFYNDLTKSDLIERKKFNSLLNEFSNSQLNFIKQNPYSLKAIRSGVKIAIEQCALEFDKERWNCSIEDNKEVFGQTLKRANRETAFIQSIISAGITYSITKACSTGNLKNCACDYKYEKYSDILKEEESNKKRSWHWGGCSDNLKYGIQLSKQFLDSTEIEELKRKPSLRLTMSLHNHKAGREAIKKLMRLKCRCHGSSGSCQLKTCWRILPNFDEIGKYLKKKYQKSLQIEALIKGVDIKRNKRSKELNNPNFKINYHSINKDQSLSQDQNTFNLMDSLNNPSFFLNKIGFNDENSFFFNDLNEGNENLNKLDSTKVFKKQLSKKVFKNSKKLNDKSLFLNQTIKSNKNELISKNIKHDLNENKPNKLDLVYIHKSPNYCNQNLEFKILGTNGRNCNKNGKKSDNCETMCCGRGYYRRIVHKIETCQCKFEWCCEVKCKTCEIITENYTCK